MSESSSRSPDPTVGRALSTDELVPLLYKELHQLASVRLSREKPGQTLQATALVNEVYLRLAGVGSPVTWENERHFFGAAAEAMRRILIDRARGRQTDKRGGEFQRVEFPIDQLIHIDDARLLELDEALSDFAQNDASAAELVKLRFFAGLTNEQAANLMGISARSASFLWAYARSWLRNALRED